MRSNVTLGVSQIIVKFLAWKDERQIYQASVRSTFGLCINSEKWHLMYVRIVVRQQPSLFMLYRRRRQINDRANSPNSQSQCCLFVH